ncbi:hypothetical protein KM043_006045 [Ampulex compressa]|nr:hypothetical protein KM043_006045 [Ampulex compressa]
MSGLDSQPKAFSEAARRLGTQEEPAGLAAGQQEAMEMKNISCSIASSRRSCKNILVSTLSSKKDGVIQTSPVFRINVMEAANKRECLSPPSAPASKRPRKSDVTKRLKDHFRSSKNYSPDYSQEEKDHHQDG